MSRMLSSPGTLLLSYYQSFTPEYWQHCASSVAQALFVINLMKRKSSHPIYPRKKSIIFFVTENCTVIFARAFRHFRTAVQPLICLSYHCNAVFIVHWTRWTSA